MSEESARPGARFVAYLKDKLPLVEKNLASSAAAPLLTGGEPRSAHIAADLDRYLYGPLAHFTAGGGKRVRPVLALLGAEAVGGRATDALSVGTAIELFQSAALVHDDIADKSELRRGEPCLHVTEGTGVALNMGDLALTQVFEVVLADDTLPADRRLAVLAELALMERHTLEGQALDLGWARDERWDVASDDYLYMVASKTAWYTVAHPLYIGALAAGATEAQAKPLVALGLHAGIAFQLQDDLLNLVGDAAAQGKDFRSDITEGKRTLSVVWALEQLGATGRDSERDELVGILGRETTDPACLARAVELIELGGGIEHCQTLAAHETAQAQELVAAQVAAGTITAEAGAILTDMAAYFVNRAK